MQAHDQGSSHAHDHGSSHEHDHHGGSIVHWKGPVIGTAIALVATIVVLVLLTQAVTETPNVAKSDDAAVLSRIKPVGELRLQAMLTAYAEGDEATLLALSDGEKQQALKHGYTADEYDQEMNDLLYARNAAWIAAIEKLHADGGGFVAVGALHLLGPRSVLDLLAHRGYRVTRVVP